MQSINVTKVILEKVLLFIIILYFFLALKKNGLDIYFQHFATCLRQEAPLFYGQFLANKVAYFLLKTIQESASECVSG